MQVRSQISTLFKKPLDDKTDAQKRYAEEIKACFFTCKMWFVTCC